MTIASKLDPALIRILVTSECPPSTETINAVTPSVHTANALAPFSSKIFTARGTPDMLAYIRGAQSPSATVLTPYSGDFNKDGVLRYFPSSEQAWSSL